MKICACPVRADAASIAWMACARARRPSPAGSRETRIPGRSCRRPSARAGSTTVRPAARPRCLRDAPPARASAPGSAIAGQPASDRSPRSRPSRAGASSCAAARRVGRVAQLDDVDLLDRQRRRRASAGRRAPAWRSRRRSGRGRGRPRSCARAARARARRRRADSARERAAPAVIDRAAALMLGAPARRRRPRAACDVSRISGRPISAVGSSLSMRSKSAMPSASERTLPAQSYGRSCAQVRLDLGGGQKAKRAAHVDERGLASARRRVEQAEPGVEDDRLAGKLRELRDGALVRPGLSDRPPVAIGDLIRADDERIGMRAGDAAGLGFGEPERRRRRRLAGERRFVGARRHGDEGQAEALEQHPPIARRRGEHEPPARRRRAAGGCVLTVVFAGIFDRIAANALLSNVFDRRARQGNGKRLGRCGRHGGGHDRAAGRQSDGTARRRIRRVRSRAPAGDDRGHRGRRLDAARGGPAGRRTAGGAAEVSWRITGTTDALGAPGAGNRARRQRAAGMPALPAGRLPGPWRRTRRCCWRATSASSRCSTTSDDTHEVILAAAPLDAPTLIEDEVLLALPFAPRCERPECAGNGRCRRRIRKRRGRRRSRRSPA